MMIDWLRANWLLLVPSVVLAAALARSSARVRTLEDRVHRMERAVLGLHFAHGGDDQHAEYLRTRRLSLKSEEPVVQRAAKEIEAFVAQAL